MRAYEFINEDASAGATSSGSVASVALPLTHSGFADVGNSSPIVLRRTYPNTKKKKKNKKGK